MDFTLLEILDGLIREYWKFDIKDHIRSLGIETSDSENTSQFLKRLDEKKDYPSIVNIANSLLKNTKLQHQVNSQFQIGTVLVADIVSDLKKLFEKEEYVIENDEIKSPDATYVTTATARSGLGIDQLIQKKMHEDSTASYSDIMQQLIQSGKSNNLQNGLYYVVLVDLADSTNSSFNIDQEDYSKRAKTFIDFVKSATDQSSGRFVKPSGDAAYLLFTKFYDIIEFVKKLDDSCEDYNQDVSSKGKGDKYLMRSKKIIHIGEVIFDESQEPNAWAVNVISKIEKYFDAGETGITDAIKQVITPEINSGKITLSTKGTFDVEDQNYHVELWKLDKFT